MNGRIGGRRRRGGILARGTCDGRECFAVERAYDKCGRGGGGGGGVAVKGVTWGITKRGRIWRAIFRAVGSAKGPGSVAKQFCVSVRMDDGGRQYIVTVYYIDGSVMTLHNGAMLC